MVNVETDGHILHITINRPEARNAVNGDVANGIEAAIDQLEEDDALWVGILSHEGPVFCAGADLKAINSGAAGGLATERGGFGGIVTRDREKPIIAACNGPAYAGGCEIAISCDMIVASTEAKFGIPEVKRSLLAAAGGLIRLPQVLPRNVAMEMALTGDPISAERAHALGMVNRLTEPGEAVAGASELAQQVAINAPLAVRASRKVMLASMTIDEQDAWNLTNKEFGILFGTEDFSEGPLAFIEKRDPVWKGR